MYVLCHTDARVREPACARGRRPVSATPAVPGAAPGARGILRHLPLLLVVAVTAAQLARLVAFTRHYAVDILFRDQWDLSGPLFSGASPWRVFDLQHGPHRQGLGGLVSWGLAVATRWDSRAEALAAVAIAALAVVAALWLRRRLFGALTCSDVVIPLLLLSRLQYEVLAGPTNLSHGPLPVLLAVLLCLAWTLPTRPARYGTVLFLNFLAVFTGFGMFLGAITPVLLALDAWAAWRAGNRRAAAGAGAALGVALLTVAAFFAGYTITPAAACPHAPCPAAWTAPRDAGLMFANAFGLKWYDGAGPIVGIVLLACAAVVLVHHARRLTRREPAAEQASRSASILLGFSLLFVLGAAAGRFQLGAPAAGASRYYLYVATGLLGLYVHLLTVRRTAVRRTGLALAVAGAALAGLHLTGADADTVARLSRGKREWKRCYVATESIAGCDRATGFVIYPRPEATGLAAKLDYLKRNQLNLYADAP